MCRSIKTLRRPGASASAGEMEAAALQFVRKISGYRRPSRANQAAFEAAVTEVAEASRRLLETIQDGSALSSAGSPPTASPPRPRSRPASAA